MVVFRSGVMVLAYQGSGSLFDRNGNARFYGPLHKLTLHDPSTRSFTLLVGASSHLDARQFAKVDRREDVLFQNFEALNLKSLRQVK